MCGATAALLMQKLSDAELTDGRVDDRVGPIFGADVGRYRPDRSAIRLGCLEQASLVPVGRDHPASGGDERADHGRARRRARRR